MQPTRKQILGALRNSRVENEFDLYCNPNKLASVLCAQWLIPYQVESQIDEKHWEHKKQFIYDSIKGHITVDRLEAFLEALNDGGCSGVADKLETVLQAICERDEEGAREQGNSVSGLEANNLGLKEIDIPKVCRIFGSDIVIIDNWGRIMDSLLTMGTDQYEVKDLRDHQHKPPYDWMKKCLDLWRQREGNKATVAALIEVCRQHQFTSIAEKLESELN